MSVNRGVDKEDVVRIHNGILLSHKKEHNCAICRDVDEPRDYLTELSQENKPLINAYIQNLGKCY